MRYVVLTFILSLKLGIIILVFSFFVAREVPRLRSSSHSAYLFSFSHVIKHRQPRDDRRELCSSHPPSSVVLQDVTSFAFLFSCTSVFSPTNTGGDHKSLFLSSSQGVCLSIQFAFFSVFVLWYLRLNSIDLEWHDYFKMTNNLFQFFCCNMFPTAAQYYSPCISVVTPFLRTEPAGSFKRTVLFNGNLNFCTINNC